MIVFCRLKSEMPAQHKRPLRISCFSTPSYPVYLEANFLYSYLNKTPNNVENPFFNPVRVMDVRFPYYEIYRIYQGSVIQKRLMITTRIAPIIRV